MINVKDFSLKLGNKVLYDNVNETFTTGKVHHLFGDNGSGKSVFAKCFLQAYKYQGTLVYDDSTVVVGSYTNVPLDLKVKDLLDLLEKKFVKTQIDLLVGTLNILSIDNIKIKYLSDGQKQKLKLLVFLAANPKTIILDEFTNALDKKTVKELYSFINKYIINNQDVTIINITHNLQDIENINGDYYYIADYNILPIDSKQELVKLYTGGAYGV